MTGGTPRFLAGLSTVARRLSEETDDDATLMIRLFWERLVGETLGDVDRTLAVVSEDFVLTTTQPNTAQSTADKADLERSAERLSSMVGHMLMWFDFDEIVAGHGSLAVFGTMHTSFAAAYAVANLGQPADATGGAFSSTSTISILCRFEGGLMSREDVMLIPDTAGLSHDPAFELPDLEGLTSALATLG